MNTIKKHLPVTIVLLLITYGSLAKAPEKKAKLFKDLILPNQQFTYQQKEEVIVSVENGGDIFHVKGNSTYSISTSSVDKNGDISLTIQELNSNASDSSGKEVATPHLGGVYKQTKEGKLQKLSKSFAPVFAINMARQMIPSEKMQENVKYNFSQLDFNSVLSIMGKKDTGASEIKSGSGWVRINKQNKNYIWYEQQSKLEVAEHQTNTTLSITSRILYKYNKKENFIQNQTIDLTFANNQDKPKKTMKQTIFGERLRN